jgi:ribosomal protein L10
MNQIGMYTTEVFQDATLRTEFRKLAQLRIVHKTILKKVAAETGKAKNAFWSYSAITNSIYREQLETHKVRGLGEGLYFLFRSLAGTMILRYNLAPAEALKLVAAVADQYETELHDSGTI